MSQRSQEPAVLEVRRASFRVAGGLLLREVSLKIEPGTIHAILGPNGAGKTTLMRVCVGELGCAPGEVLLNGTPLHQLGVIEQAQVRAYAGSVAHVPFPYSVREICRLGAWDTHADTIDQVLTLLDGADFSDRLVSSLSNGERERVLTARSLIQLWDGSGPRVVLLDEPTASLDPAHQQVTMRALRQASERGIAVVIVVHDLNLALRYADAATLIKDGRIQASGPVTEVLSPTRLSQLFDVPIGLFAVDGLSRPLAAVID